MQFNCSTRLMLEHVSARVWVGLQGYSVRVYMALCRINMKRPGSAEGAGLFANLGSKGSGGPAVLKPLAPPPSYTPAQVCPLLAAWRRLCCCSHAVLIHRVNSGSTDLVL